MISFSTNETGAAGPKRVDVYPAASSGRPVVYLNTYEDQGAQVGRLLRGSDGPAFSLVVIHNLDWNHDMTPWACPPLSKTAIPATGGADAYLALLLGEILPRAEKALPGPPAWRGLAGYSLAGLFALYALCQTGAFTRIASVSGSLWFPGIQEYVAAHVPPQRPDRLYFSVGDREHKARNPALRAVRKNTQAIAAFYQAQGIPTNFQLNPGNHFQDSALRTAAGIRWLCIH